MFVVRMYFTVTPGKYDEAAKLMKQVQAMNQRLGLKPGRVLTGHFVSPGSPNWHWEAEFESLAAIEEAFNKIDDDPEMAKLGPATVDVWNQNGIEVYHVVEL